MLQPKTYVLLDALDSNAPIYQQLPGNKRTQLKKIPVYPLYLQVTITTAEGINRTMRYKGNAKSIWQDEQIKDGIPANDRFTTNDRAELRFRNGVLVTKKPLAQDYIANYPGNVNFQGNCDAIPQPFFKELDPVADNKLLANDFKKRLKAANKIAEMEGDVEALSTFLIRLNGSYFVTPNDPGELYKMAISFLDDAEEEGLDLILKEEESLNIDEKTTILIGKLINAGKLSFTQNAEGISKMGKDGKWVVVRNLGKEYSMEEKQRLFANFLNTADGKALKTDLENDLEDEGGAPKKVKSLKQIK